jgi:hypothetical protein
MRVDMALASSTNDGPSLARTLDRVSNLAPDASWSWASISRNGADAARRGDLTAARAACATCHQAYKADWRARYRDRAVP